MRPDPLDARLDRLRAQEERDLARGFGRKRCRRPEIVVAGNDDEVRPLVEDFEAGFGALGAVGLGVGGDNS